MPNKAREKFKTYGNVFDNFTVASLKRLIGQGHFTGLESPVSMGKEANIFTGRGKEGVVAVKIYRLEACDFNRMYDYLKFDVRYPSIKKGKRNIVFTWTQREYRNLLNAREGNVTVPKPITRINNVLVSEFIGNADTGEPAMKVKQHLPADAGDFFEQVIDNMRKLFQAGLVHGDLSEYNILNLDNKAIFIDFSQSSSVKSSNAAELLHRDAHNIAKFFQKLGVKTDEKAIRDRVTRK